MKIFTKDGDAFKQLKPRPFKNEDELQQLIEKHPKLIPVDLDVRRIAVREFPTESGPIDHVVVDAKGKVLILETKLAANSTRREVIAQAIDYAAQLTKFGPQAFLDKARTRAGADFTEDWFESVGEREDFMRELETNLRLGKLNLLIVMDFAEGRLKDAVQFLNRATHFNCLIVEVTVSEVGGRELVGVDVYGQEIIGQNPVEPTRNNMSKSLFLETKSKSGREAEAQAFLGALGQLESQGVPTHATPAGFYLKGEPQLGNHYLMWQVVEDRIHIWTPAAHYEDVTRHLRKAPSPWRDRIHTRPLKQGGQYGKVAEVDVFGMTNEEDFRALFTYYLGALAE